MDDENFGEPMYMFPPDILVGRMDQVRKLVEAMKGVDNEQFKLLHQASQLLLDSCDLTYQRKQSVTPDDGSNITQIH